MIRHLLFLAALLPQATLVFGAENKASVWIEVEVYNSREEDNPWLCGRLSVAEYAALVSTNSGQKFIRLYDCRAWDQDQKAYQTFEDEQDTGEVTVPTRLILQIVRKKGDPLTLPVPKHLLEPGPSKGP